MKTVGKNIAKGLLSAGVIAPIIVAYFWVPIMLIGTIVLAFANSHSYTEVECVVTGGYWVSEQMSDLKYEVDVTTCPKNQKILNESGFWDEIGEGDAIIVTISEMRRSGKHILVGVRTQNKVFLESEIGKKNQREVGVGKEFYIVMFSIAAGALVVFVTSTICSLVFEKRLRPAKKQINEKK